MRSLAQRRLFAIAAACMFGTGALTASHAPALAQSCFSIKDNGQVGGRGGFFLRDNGHVAMTTQGTGSCFDYSGNFVHNGRSYHLIVSTSGLCVNTVAVNDYVYMDGCVDGDAHEEWWPQPGVNGATVFQNFAFTSNLTAFVVVNGSFVKIAGGSAKGTNQWVCNGGSC
jgi:hypothetical protein